MSDTAILNTTDTSELERCEAVIERGLATFYEVGTALLQIRDGRLYRATHDTFEAYCRERWSMSRHYANRLIEASNIAENLVPVGTKPTSERQVRPLASLEPEHQRVAWEQAVAESDGQQPTAVKVHEVSKTLSQMVADRMAERNIREADAPSRASVEADEPPPTLTRREFVETRERMKANSEHLAQVMNFIRAIEVLSEPTLSLVEVAEEIRDMDTPDKNWTGRAKTAESNLSTLVEEIAR